MRRIEDFRTVIGKALRNRWFGTLIAGVGLGAVVAYLLVNRPKVGLVDQNAVDEVRAN